MNIKIYAIGKSKDFYLSGCNEYIKRLSAYAKVQVIELKDDSLSENPSQSEITKAKDNEGKRVLTLLKPNEYLIGLDLVKKEMSSEEFAKYIDDKLVSSDDLKKRCNDKIALSTLTFPHQLARLVLLEQIYRAFKIINNETYHK